MNRRDFVIRGTASSIALTILSPISAKSQSAFSKSSVSPHTAATTPAWLKRFNGASVSDLLHRRRTKLLIEAAFPNLTAPFWWNRSVFATAWSYMKIPDSVTVYHNRYVAATGSMAFCASNRALLWVDTSIAPGATAPRAIFAVVDVWTDSRHIWIMDNLSIAGGSASEPPPNLKRCLSRWLRLRKPFFWDGGLVQQISLNLNSLTSPLNPVSYGIPLHRCEAGVY